MSYRRIFFRLLCFGTVIYTLVCVWVYFSQEELLFHPKKLTTTCKFAFDRPFDEFSVPVSEGKKLNAVLFKSDKPNGQLVFFLHGNAGNIQAQEGVAAFYNDLGYDFLTYDYRGFGKSSGFIESENQFLLDAQLVYNRAKKHFAETQITIIGYSIGTGAASWLAAHNHPTKLALMAPYYSMTNLSAYHYPIFPGFILKYKFETFRYLPKLHIPIGIFHGKDDGTIPFYSSKMLAGLLKKDDRFIPINDQGHGGFENNIRFQSEMKKFLK